MLFCQLSRVRIFVTPWTLAHQAPLFMGFPRQEYWSGFPFPSPKDLLDQGIEPTSPVNLMLPLKFYELKSWKTSKQKKREKTKTKIEGQLQYKGKELIFSSTTCCTR